MKKILRRTIKFGFILLALGVLAGGATFAFFAKDLPDPEEVLARSIAQSTKIYDRTGQVLLYEVHGEQKRTVVPLENIPLIMRRATLAAEDDKFYEHFGLDISSLVRALLTSGGGGASTITQQYIKNALLTSERTVARKIKEIILTLELERRYSKDDILGFYLNQIPYGANAYGVEAAAQTFFGKSIKDVTLVEAATLAALPKAPSYLSPYGSNPEALAARRQYVLNRLAKLKYITDAEKEAAKNSKVAFTPQRAAIVAPHFVFYVRELLESRYGKEVLETGGLKITTTLDATLQGEAEKIVQDRAADNEKRFKIGNAAAVVLDPATGQILSLVGSRDYFDQTHDGNVNVITRLRQPGSSFKPFVYAAAFEKGYTPNTTIFDAETVFLTAANKSYLPNNYDGLFRGPVSMRSALAQSLNIPAVKTLYLVGVEPALQYAERFGITSLKDRSRFDLALVLGGAEVTPLEMASGYGVFASEGFWRPAAAILKVEDGRGSVLEQFSDAPQEVIKPQIARLISDVLSDNAARAPIFGVNNSLVIPDRPAAAKTGTTQNFYDAWSLGYTPQRVVVVWTGNNNNDQKIIRASGSMAAAPIWHDLMVTAHRDLPVQNFTPPDPVVTGKPILDGLMTGQTVKLDTLSGKLATEYTPLELVAEKTYREAHNILHYLSPADPLGPAPAPEKREPAYAAWETAVQAWITQHPDANLYNEAPPTEYDSVHTPDAKPLVIITSPAADSHVSINGLLTITATVNARNQVKQVDFLINDTLIGTDSTFPYQVSVTLNQFLKPTDGLYQITARAFDVFQNNGVGRTNVSAVGPVTGGQILSLILAPPAGSTFPVTLRATPSFSAPPVERVTFYYAEQASLSPSFLAARAANSGSGGAGSAGWEAVWSSAPTATAPGGVWYVFAVAETTDQTLVRSNVIEITH